MKAALGVERYKWAGVEVVGSVKPSPFPFVQRIAWTRARSQGSARRRVLRLISAL
jgi:hypothetical protein